uniref:Putative juvenile hormone n=1 Tax=Rhodnius prolixus TaxID=13249 RepID=R4G4A0_RHOPR
MARQLLTLIASVVYILSTPVQGGQPELCSLSAKNLPQCLITAIQNVIPILVKGIPRYGVYPMDPMHIDTLDLSNSPGKTLNVKHKFTNVDLQGLSSAVIRHVRLNPKTVEIDVNAILSKPVVLTGNYVSQGKILTLPIRGGGKFNITLINMRAALKMRGHQTTKNGKVHVMMNSVLNENWESVLEDMKPSFEEAIGSAFKEFANRIFNRIPQNYKCK